MNRRLALGTLGGLALAGAPVLARSQNATHDHAAHTATASAAAYDKLRTSAALCTSAGQACLAHCLRVLADGDKSLGECARTLNQMLSLCTALEGLAAQGSAFTPALAKLALDACEQCATACKPHFAHHVECKICHDACVDCVEHCKTVI